MEQRIRSHSLEHLKILLFVIVVAEMVVILLAIIVGGAAGYRLSFFAHVWIAVLVAVAFLSLILTNVALVAVLRLLRKRGIRNCDIRRTVPGRLG
jgi:ABC-type glycerol-3-phosphate transport system permease component